MLLFYFLPFMQSDVHVTTNNAVIRDAQQQDAYTDDGLAAGYAYPVNATYRLSFTNDLCTGTTLVNYVGGNVTEFGFKYQRSAIKFDITGIIGITT